ncbi:MAG: APC family permease [Gemmatimonadota bacterium]
MTDSHGSLQRVLGVGFGVAVIVGGAVGVGILRTPGAIAGMLQQPRLILFAWGLGGAYALLQANNLAELATAVPNSGGPYVFARRALGPYGGFVVGWADWLSLVVAMAYLPLAFGDFSARLVPSLAGWESAVAVAALAIVLALQLHGVRTGSTLQELVAILKGAALVGFVALCLTAAPASPVASAGPVLFTRAPGIIAFAGALQLIIGAYGGWYAAAFFGGEQRDAARGIPRALIIGVVVMTTLYLAMNVAYLRILPMPEFVASTLPAASAVQRLVGGSGDRAVTALSMLLLLGIINAIIMIAPRALFALARDGLFLRRASEVNAGGTPAIATLATVAIAFALAVTGTFERLFALTAFLIIVVDATNNVSLLVLRRREPMLARPYRALGAPASTIVSLLAALALLGGFVASDPRTAAMAMVFIACSYPLFRVATRGARATAVP